ncbi:hypothetical protein FGRMN_1519 [Fusarium graminum]|nr:hypothetical protein FGRMN_1519 [Fusarium graminum]
MRCDVRPVISDGENRYIDPFAEPISCACFGEHSVRPWLQCDTHGCCMKCSEMEWCPEVHSCNDVIELHRYGQARRQTRNIWGPAVGSMWNLPMRPIQPESWQHIQNLEDCLFMGGMPYMTAFSPILNTAVINLVGAGRLILSNKSMLDDLQNSIDARKAMHDASHGEACERVLNEWECVSRRPIETAKAFANQTKRVLIKQQELFESSWALIKNIMWRERIVGELTAEV